MIREQLKGRTYTVNLTPKIKQKNVQNEANQAVKSAKKVTENNKIPLNFEVKKEQLVNKLKIVAKEYNRLFSNQDLTKKYNNLLNSANVAKNTADLRKVRSELSAFKTELKATGYATMSWGSKFKESIKRYANFFSGASFVYTLVNQLKNAASEAKTLDDRLVDLQKVTDEIEDRDALYKYFDRAMSKAKELNVKVDSLIYAITEFKKMGWSLDNAKLGGQWATILSNVGDLDIDSAIGSIKTAIASFDEIGGYTDEQMSKKLEAYTDLINEMSNRYSIDAEGLAEAIRISAGTLTQAHTSIEEAAAMFATANRFYNDPNYLGNTAKIGSLRLRASTSTDARKELEELGEDMDDVADSASSLREKLLSLTGVDIMEADGQTFKSFYQQLFEISEVIDELSDTSRANVLETIFGKARAAAGQALISGLQTEGVKAYETAINSAGSATKEYQTWCESASASIQRFQNALTETYQSIINGNTVRDLTNLGTALLDLANKFGLIQGTLRGIVAIGIGKFVTTGAMAFATATKQVEKYGVALKAVKDMPLDGNLAERYHYLKTIAVATQNLTSAQLKNVLSSKELSQQDRIRILRLQGLSKEIVAQKLKEMGLTDVTNAQTVANKAQTASVFSLKTAMIGLGRTIKTAILSNPVGAVLMAVSLGYSAISSAVSKHNQEVEETRQKTKEAADEASAMSDEISELANKYIKLSDAVKTDSGAKEELLSTQEELLRKLNLEGETIDTLVEKYGSLSEAIKQVSIDNLKDQQIDLIANVDTTTEELFETAKKNFSKSIVAMGKEAGKAWQVLDDAGIISSGTHTSRGGEWFLQGDNKTIEGVLQNYETLSKAVAALRDSSVFTADELADNELFQEIYKRYNNAKESVEGYSSAIGSLNKNVAHQLTISALQGKDIPKTVEEFETFKQALIETSIASKQFIGDEQEITTTIENYLATLPEFQEFFNNSIQEVRKIINDKSKNLDFSDLFNNDSIDDTKQKLLDLATSGELSAETITSTEEYKALLDELGISADEFVSKIKDFNIQYNLDNYTDLIDTLTRVRNGESLTESEASKLIATYDTLGGELVKTANGYSFNESALISLANKYSETSNVAISREIQSTDAAIQGVEDRLEAWGVEVDFLEKIQAVYEETGSKIAVMNYLAENGVSKFLTSNLLDAANELNGLKKKRDDLSSKYLEQIETSTTKSTETALDRITKKYKELTDVIGSNVNLIKSQISLLETRGSTVGRGYYDELISQSTEKINVLTEQYNELRKQFLQTDKGTEEWLELNAAILETQDAIIGAKTDIEGFQNSIDKLHWDELDKIADAIGNISDEAKSVIDLLNTDDVLDDNGNFTKDAITAFAMYGEQLESAQYLINKYSKEIEYLNGEYTKGTITVEEYNEKMQDLNDKQWESVDAYNAAKKAIIELRKQGIEEEIDALEDLYDARKKAWEQEKDQHDWEKTVSENETNINKLKAQIAELQNDNSLAGIKKRKELEDELKKTESDWEDTLYDHVYDERQDQLDKELEDKKTALEKTLDDEEKLVADSIDLVNQNCFTVLDNLNRLSREYGIQMSSSLTEPFTHGENALSHYSTMFSQANSAFTEQLNYTYMGIYQLQTDADNAAVSVINMFNSANGTLLEQLSLVRQSLQEIIDKANEAAGALRNTGASNPDTSSNKTYNTPSSRTNSSLGDVAHDTSGTSLPSAGTFKNAQNDIEKAKKELETIEKQKKVGLIKGTSSNKFTTISKGYATGTKSATKGWHPMFEEGIEAIEKDGELLVPLSGGEMVFNNEQLLKLWEFSNDPENMAKLSASIYGNMPKFGGNLIPNIPNNTQNVNVEQHFDALVKVEGDMTPDVLAQLTNDRKIVQRVKDIAMEGNVEAYCTRGYRIR